MFLLHNNELFEVDGLDLDNGLFRPKTFECLTAPHGKLPRNDIPLRMLFTELEPAILAYQEIVRKQIKTYQQQVLDLRLKLKRSDEIEKRMTTEIW